VLGIPAARLLADRIALFAPRLSDAVLAIGTSRRAIEVLRPRCVYVMDAYDLWAQALVVAARDAGIRSVEVQHGIIEKNHSGYLHLDGEVAPDQDQHSPHSPIADVIVVHGDGAREALVEHGHFPTDSIRVTGSPNIAAARSRQGDRRAIRSRSFTLVLRSAWFRQTQSTCELFWPAAPPCLRSTRFSAHTHPINPAPRDTRRRRRRPGSKPRYRREQIRSTS
jgi:hypothetical protein